MQRLVQMLFSDREAAPTIERIEPGENDPINYVHLLMIEGQYAVLGGYGIHGFTCANHYRCLDESLFAKAMRLLRIIEITDLEGTVHYTHLDTGREIPSSEVVKVRQLVRERA